MDYANYTVEDFLTDERFVNYCLGTDEADIRHWERVVRDHPDLARPVKEAKAMILFMAIKADDDEKDRELGRLKRAIEAERDAPVYQKVRQYGLSRVARRWLSVAATLLLMGSAYLIFTHENTVDSAISYALEQTQPSMAAHTGTGERQRTTLPDGSTVLLNGSSRLHIADGFNASHRVVWLEGDAYFEVAKNAERPFIVRTASTVTTALGTSFRVTNYASQPEPHVMLTSGKVQVDHIVAGKAVASTVLLPGHMATIQVDRQLVARSFDPEQIASWLASRLQFNGADFTEIKDKLHDVYGVSLMADEKIAQHVAFTGQFAARPLQEVLDAIAFSNRVQFAMEGNHIYMTP